MNWMVAFYTRVWYAIFRIINKMKEYDYYGKDRTFHPVR